MSLQRLLYRGRQFWFALHRRPAARDFEQAHLILGPELYTLFLQMQPGEQAHSLHVMHQLQDQGENDPDLMVAALLHDVGKICRKLHLWERVWIVIARKILGERVTQLGEAGMENLPKLPFWQQPLVVAQQHPAWGAQMVAAAGGTPLSVRLVLCHADRSAAMQPGPEGRLLALLQFVDDNS